LIPIKLITTKQPPPKRKKIILILICETIKIGFDIQSTVINLHDNKLFIGTNIAIPNVVFYLEQFQGITQRKFNDWLGQLLIGIITAYCFPQLINPS